MGHLSPESIKAIAVCAVFFLAVLGAIVYALLEHQRKMAEILRSDRKQTEGLDERVDALQGEIRELKSLLMAQQLPQTGGDDLQQRVR
jgi:hypothetical protein